MALPFTGRRPSPEIAARIPPGQHMVTDFPVLSAGPTPRIAQEDWRLTLKVGPRTLAEWSWDTLRSLPMTVIKPDIHCVTEWTKLDTTWEGVRFDDLLAAAGLNAPPTPFVLAHGYDGYTTNVPAGDLANGRAMVAVAYEGAPISADHGGPARLLVPHLYFWKSAKWLKSLQFTPTDTAGFWELRGYHMYGDPWREQRYSED